MGRINRQDMLLARLVSFAHDHLQETDLGVWAQDLYRAFVERPVVRYCMVRRVPQPETCDIRHGRSYIVRFMDSLAIEVNLFDSAVGYLRVLVEDGVVSSLDWSALVSQ